MKKLMFALVAALSLVALAQDGEGAKPDMKDKGRRGPRDRMAMMGDRNGMGMPSGLMGETAMMAAMNPKIAEKLGLSAEARDQIRKLDTENREKIRELQAKVRAAMDKQGELMKADKIDEAAVMATIDEVFDCRKEMAKSQTKRLISVKAMLTPEQIKQAVEAMKELRGERRAKRDRGPKPEFKDGPKPECKDGPKPECKGCPAPAEEPAK